MNTLFHDTMSGLASGLRCELVAQQVDLLPCDSLDEARATALDYGLGRAFSHVILQIPSSEDDLGAAHVAFIDFANKSVDIVRRVQPADLLAPSTPLAQLPELLLARTFYLTLRRNEIEGIITRSDINALPVRTCLLTVLQHLESIMADTIDQLHSDNDWLDTLPPGRRDKTLALHEQKESRDVDTRLIDCTCLSDKFTVARKSDRLLQDWLPKKVRQVEKSVVRFRDRMAHSMPPVPPSSDVNLDAWDEIRDHLLHASPIAVSESGLRDLADALQLWLELIDKLGARSHKLTSG